MRAESRLETSILLVFSGFDKYASCRRMRAESRLETLMFGGTRHRTPPCAGECGQSPAWKHGHNVSVFEDMQAIRAGECGQSPAWKHESHANQHHDRHQSAGECGQSPAWKLGSLIRRPPFSNSAGECGQSPAWKLLISFLLNLLLFSRAGECGQSPAWKLIVIVFRSHLSAVQENAGRVPLGNLAIGELLDDLLVHSCRRMRAESRLET